MDMQHQPGERQVTSLRFLMTDNCNLRCTFCHNEFQGDAVPGRSHAWNFELVERILHEYKGRGLLRAKFSGGEPLLQWDNLNTLLGLCRKSGVGGLTIFSNLTLLSAEKMSQLARLGVEQVHSNLPSFVAERFSARTAQSRWDLDSVLTAARTVRTFGALVQFNLVVPASETNSSLTNLLQEELRQAEAVSGSWDALAFIADDWGLTPSRTQIWVRDFLRSVPGAYEVVSPPERSYEFMWQGKTLYSSKCTNWSEADERRLADLYVLPPGRIAVDHVRGKAYRLNIKPSR
jgi:organic radical activating enzyme